MKTENKMNQTSKARIESIIRRRARGETVDVEKEMLDMKTLAKTDPVKRNAKKDLESIEHTPMEPPSAYEEPGNVKIAYEEMEKLLQVFVEEHQNAIEKVDKFEEALGRFKEFGYQLDPKINEAFREFFSFLDDDLLPHNEKEEKVLFPILHKRLISVGEHSTGKIPTTAIDVMEDDHVKFIQLGALTFNFLGLAPRLRDVASRNFVFDTAYQNGRELTELIRLHIYREDHILFPLAQQHLSKEEFEIIEQEMHGFQ